MLTPLTQTLPIVAPDAWHLVGEGALVAGVMVVRDLWNSRNTKKQAATKKVERTTELDDRLQSIRHAISLTGDGIRAEITELAGEVKDLKAHVIGPDGQNGLRADVRELKDDVRGLLRRSPTPRKR